MNAIELLEKFCKNDCKAEGHCDWPLCNVEQARLLLRAECEWTWDEHHDKWDTSCGEAYCVMEGDLKDNKIIGCPFCTKRIKEVK